MGAELLLYALLPVAVWQATAALCKDLYTCELAAIITTTTEDL
jgi:hypothetical protein